jgi:hypothetical protein
MVLVAAHQPCESSDVISVHAAVAEATAMNCEEEAQIHRASVVT